MIITCQSSINMGYIYLMPICNNKDISEGYKEYLTNNDLSRYVNINSMRIPINDNFIHTDLLDRMKISERTYKEARGKVEEFGEEYLNDLDANGYMEGIELNLSKDRLLTLIQDNSFQIFKHHWIGKDFIILTLDRIENVFDIDNIIYPFSNMRDAFAIVHIDERYQTGLIKGIISAREDLYPLSYLCKPDFILWDDDVR